MLKIRTLKILIVTFICLGFLFTFSFLTACGGPEPIEETRTIEKEAVENTGEGEVAEILEEEVEEVEETGQVIEEEPSGPCDNSYFPIKENMIWIYKIEATGIESFEYSLSFKDVADNSFIQVITLPDAVIESNWICSEEGILQNEYRELSFTDSSLGSIEYETVGVEGITFPPEEELIIGKTWNVLYDTKAKIKVGDSVTNATVKVETDFKIVSIEPVQVPAGNYPEALNILNTVTISISSDFLNTTFVSDSNSWFAKDVGWVKNVGTMEDTENITELMSLN